MKKMREVILEYLQSNLSDSEFTAHDISKVFKVKRNVSSHYLNQLFQEGYLDKNNKSRPVQFCLREKINDPFENLIGSNESLKIEIQKCKAAVLYPPAGLPLIIRGNSGVGKSYLASLIYDFSKQKEVISKEGKFVTLNCADYANNPDLLSAALFGYKKGAFTGAEKDTGGLISQADGGILFLDEVHNLSAENQEKLFLLIDSGKFRPLGENEGSEFAKVRLILATTKDTKETLLTTFRRRIPVEVNLPDYEDRSYFEKYSLITSFFGREMENLQCNLSISIQKVEKLITAKVAGNIGEISNQIKLMCADAYIHRTDETVYIGDSEKKIFFRYEDMKGKDYYKSLTNTFPLEINNTMNRKPSSNMPDDVKQIEEKMKIYIVKKFNTIQFFFAHPTINMLKQWFSISFKEILTKKGIEYKETLMHEMVLFVYSIEQLDRENTLYLNELLKETQPNNKASYLAHLIMEKVELPVKVHNNIFHYLSYLLSKYYPDLPELHSLIVMHGENLASSMAKQANQLLSNYVYEGFDMPIDSSTTDIIKKIKAFNERIDTSQGLVLLVDMGSLEHMYKEIKGHIIGDLIILNNVSTALTLELGMMILTEKPVSFLTQMNYDSFSVKIQYFEGISQKKNIIISCLSGEGIAEKIKGIICPFIVEEVEILIFDSDELSKLIKENDKKMFSHTICTITTMDYSVMGTPHLNLEKVIEGTQTLSPLRKYWKDKEMEEKCLNDLIKFFTIEGASSKLRFLNPQKVINDVEKVISSYEKIFQVKIPSFLRINFFLHLSLMIERILMGDISEKRSEFQRTQPYKQFLLESRKIFTEIQSIYGIDIPEGEYELIYDIFEKFQL
ncbi:sigma 54-interacting transcriptional regulator [Oceanobacillus sojae]|uniref:sigma 54-interacting transcriptional regulator n=1 Tax=Oceanobacillus sojae TaxID=582851 RepID=UPI0021A91E8B|nr:sigma 54-interacting transcriptional regulator [Oceanobacillus sojae]MCT1905234.1 sigma 54-interacting transcriptional regulator [Oceanobacillus sojae]